MFGENNLLFPIGQPLLWQKEDSHGCLQTDNVNLSTPRHKQRTAK